MKRGGIYRFSLQFGSDTSEQIRAGEFLERLGNKKSAVIIAALNEYFDKHSELQSSAPIIIKKENGLPREELESLILRIVQEQLSKNSGLCEPDKENQTATIAEDIAQMLGNLDLFSV